MNSVAKFGSRHLTMERESRALQGPACAFDEVFVPLRVSCVHYVVRFSEARQWDL